jgi:mycothiol synthase
VTEAGANAAAATESANLRIAQFGHLAPDQVAAVVRLVDDVTDSDGVRPLSEHVMLHLRYGGDTPARNFLLYAGERLVGYAHLDTTDVVEGPSAELAVHPAHRRAGVGSRLVTALLAATADGRLRLWAHGQHPAAAALGARMGFRRARVLWQMRRSLFAPLDRPVLPPGVTIRTFRVGQDEAAWTEVNNRAFANHPDQGRWSLAEVATRELEPWFDPAGFFLAERTGRLVGFHWTKVHGARSGGHDHEPIGEVYVVGVDPAEQGRGLGPALVLTGLRHLRARGLAQAMLYVEADNAPAIAVYQRLGFTHWDTDISFRRG